jgi:NTP-dependent ternary system trypsin peptidase co-occuring protein
MQWAVVLRFTGGEPMTAAHPEKFGEVEVLIVETQKSPVVGGTGIQPTAVDWQRFVPLKKVVTNVVATFSDEFSKIAGAALPNEIELTFSLGLSGGGWLLGVEGEGSISITCKWKKQSES